MLLREPPWSLLRTRWLDVPIGEDPGEASPSWAVFSEAFERCLLGVSLHVARRVVDRAQVECIVTEVLVENLDVLVSRLGRHEMLHRLLTAADLLIARSASAGAGGTDFRNRRSRRERLGSG